MILSKQQTSLGNFDFNVDLEPGSPPSPASSTPPVSPPPGYPQSPNSQQLPDSPQSIYSLQSVDWPQPPVSQLSPLSSSTFEPPNEVFNMVLNEPLAANACHNQKNLSPNQSVNFKYPKSEYKDSNRSFQPQWYKRWKWLHYNGEQDSVTCYVCWHAYLHHMLPNMKIDDAFIESGYTNWKNATDTKKGFDQHEISAVHRSTVNRFAEVPSSTDDIAGTVTKNLLKIQQKNFSALMKILSSIRYLARQRLPLRSHNNSESNFRQFYCGQKMILTFRNGFTKK